jgi:hypothetical protein
MYTLLKLVNVSRGKKGPSSAFAGTQARKRASDELTGTRVVREGKEMLVRVRDWRFDQALMDWKR